MEDNIYKMKKKIRNIHPFSTYVSTWIGLVMLTGLTVTISGLSLGRFSVLGCILIAAIKSTLVIWFFMNIKYEDAVFKIMLGVALLTLVTIFLLTFADVAFR
ncbi:MAG: cytochrome C oxidase subunit IV family protein [Candidatus Omnitrophota bacterium]